MDDPDEVHRTQLDDRQHTTSQALGLYIFIVFFGNQGPLHELPVTFAYVIGLQHPISTLDVLSTIAADRLTKKKYHIPLI